jgi:hypothetical protein
MSLLVFMTIRENNRRVFLIVLMSTRLDGHVVKTYDFPSCVEGHMVKNDHFPYCFEGLMLKHYHLLLAYA